MKTIILCGGRGTRIAEETTIRPKPMIEIGNKPILWHIMNGYAQYGFKDFVLALGYKGEVIKDYFHKFYSLSHDLEIDFASGKTRYFGKIVEDWKVAMIDTGIDSMTGGRLLRLRDFMKEEELFLLTYGDGVADVNISALVEFHKKHGKIATVTAVRPPARFGELSLDGEQVKGFMEKPQASVGWINGGFFVFSKKIFDYIDNDQTVLEKAPLERIASEGQMMAFRHQGFWQCMDTLRDKEYLNDLWESGEAPWSQK